MGGQECERRARNSTGMEQLLYMAIAWCLGVVVCAYAAYRIVARYQLPWKSALMYFGVLAYPGERAAAARLRTRAAQRELRSASRG